MARPILTAAANLCRAVSGRSPHNLACMQARLWGERPDTARQRFAAAVRIGRAMTFEDHYSGHADAYARHRPRYPDELFAWLASVIPGRALAWDAGTGNGQVAVALTEHVDRVVATDASADQLARAEAHERVAYRNEPADRVSLPSGSVDLITAGAAAHWFELEG